LNIEKFENITVIQTAFPGDVVLVFPLLEELKCLAPNSKLRLVTTKIGAEIAKSLSKVDKVIIFDKRGKHAGIKGVLELSKILKMNNHCIISPHRSFRTSVISYLAKPLYSITFNKTSFSFLYSKTIKYINNYHEIDRNLELLKGFDELLIRDKKEIKVSLNIDSEITKRVDDILIENGITNKDRIIILAPGSSWGTKMWGKDKYIELAKKIKDKNYNVIITGSPNELEICYEVAQESNAINLANKINLLELTYLIKIANQVICNDSAPTHIANLVGTKVTTIYGPTSPIFGFYPYRDEDDIIYKDLECSPCNIHGPKICPIGTHECMKSISAELIMSKIKIDTR